MILTTWSKTRVVNNKSKNLISNNKKFYNLNHKLTKIIEITSNQNMTKNFNDHYLSMNLELKTNTGKIIAF